jgi:hypothetical protein
VQLSEEAERKLADQRMKEWSKDQEEYTEREHQLAEQKREAKRKEEPPGKDCSSQTIAESGGKPEKKPAPLLDQEIASLRKKAKERRQYEAKMMAKIEQQRQEEEEKVKEEERKREREKRIAEISAEFKERRIELGREFDELNSKLGEIGKEEWDLKRRSLSGSKNIKKELEEKGEQRRVVWSRRMEVLKELDDISREIGQKLRENGLL